MRTITFYSYKGGVGRTLAVANTARLLAAKGESVLLLDLDLEAPGLPFKLGVADQVDDVARPGGIVEYVSGVVHGTGIKPVGEYVIRVPDAPGAKAPIHLMPAGRAGMRSYWQRLSELSWYDLFAKEDGKGVPLLLVIKDMLDEKYRPDVLLIDSRTGITEVGGAALTVLTDAVVCLFACNEESLQGTREIIRAVNEVPRIPGQRALRVVPVLTRVPVQPPENEEPLVARARAKLGLEAGATLVVLHSEPSLELEERVLVTDATAASKPLCRDYLALFEALDVKDLDVLRVGALLEQAALVSPELAERELRVAMDLAGLDHPDAARVRLRLARVLEGLSKTDEAEGLFRSVAEDLPVASAEERLEAWQHVLLLRVSLGKLDSMVADLRNLMAGWHVEPAFLRELWERQDRAPSRRHPVYWAICRAYVGRLLETANEQDEEQRIDEAEGVLKKAIVLFESQGDEGRLDLLEARTERALLSKRRRRFAAAEAELHDVNRLYEGLLRPEDQSRRRVQTELRDIVALQGRTDEADALQSAEERRLRRRRPPRAAIPSLPPLLPVRCVRLSRQGPSVISFSVDLEVVTPLLGGGTRTRHVDAVDVIRTPSIRGQLRTWWRALFGGAYRSRDLFEAEAGLWGAAAEEGASARSSVELGVRLHATGAVDVSDVRLYGADATPGAYALFPAREMRGRSPQPAAERRKPGTRFTLAVRCRNEDERAVRAVIRAWILFGGYGGRTRRGCGTLALSRPEERRMWLPGAATREAFEDVFGEDVLAPIPGRAMDDLPLLRGAWLRAGAPRDAAESAWVEAVEWLRRFRQGEEGGARERGADRKRTGRSNWPEADKVRRLSGPGPWAHEPQHGKSPCWPRAGFGLPILGQFQRKDRNRSYYRNPEPEDFDLRWRDRDGEPRDRLASPLIVKAVPLADGRFVPSALWLFRGYPDGEVILKPQDPRSPGSEAPFDLLVAPGDSARFAPLAAGSKEHVGGRLRKAFFDELAKNPTVRRVAP